MLDVFAGFGCLCLCWTVLGDTKSNYPAICFLPTTSRPAQATRTFRDYIRCFREVWTFTFMLVPVVRDDTKSDCPPICFLPTTSRPAQAARAFLNYVGCFCGVWMFMLMLDGSRRHKI
ncbi:hypothetical protein B0H15DRAFT_826311 [Mycena belliarum]|uniref:Secreted protein n=1 Tax=Mycena belliarum TaxID=1033014 RepID=A0AAD6UA35_9AGAR|nr:hypothetical protein B0H15DRAFT_826311 [Mycena belliae]